MLFVRKGIGVTSNDYFIDVAKRFDAACDEIGFELSLVTQMAALLQRLERRGFIESVAGRLIVERLKDATLGRTIAKASRQQENRDRARVKQLEETLREIESLAASA